MSITGSTLTVFTTDLNLSGSFVTQLIVSLPSFPTVPPVVKTFTVNVICQIIQLDATMTSKTLFEIGTTGSVAVSYSIT